MIKRWEDTLKELACKTYGDVLHNVKNRVLLPVTKPSAIVAGGNNFNYGENYAFTSNTAFAG